MRNYLATTLLVISVITLSLSSLILATKVADLRGQLFSARRIPATRLTPRAIPPEVIAVSKDVTITRIDPSRAIPGRQVRIYGTAFVQRKTSVRFGDQMIEPTAVNATGKTLLFNVPRNLPAGTYPVSVSSTKGVSNVVFFTISTPVRN